MSKRCAVTILILILLSACGESPPPQRLEDLSSHITRIDTIQEQGRPVLLEIVLFHASSFSEASYFDDAASEMLSILKGIQSYFPETPADHIRFELTVPLTDRYGNTSPDAVLQLTFDRADLRRINFAGDFYSWDLLNLAYVRELLPAGKSLRQAWCQEGTGAEYATHFCR